MSWNSRALLAYTVREFAGTWFALTLEGSSLPLVWGILRSILALKGTVLWVIRRSAHVGFALASTVGSTSVVASKVVLGDMNATEPTSDSKATNIWISRTAALAIGVLHWSIREGTLQIAANLVIAVWHETLIGTTLTLTVTFADVWRGLLLSSGGNTKAEELILSLGPGHRAGLAVGGIARGTVISGGRLDVRRSDTFEFPKLILATWDDDNRLDRLDFAGSSLC
jgi:hypothetical protein